MLKEYRRRIDYREHHPCSESWKQHNQRDRTRRPLVSAPRVARALPTAPNQTRHPGKTALDELRTLTRAGCLS